MRKNPHMTSPHEEFYGGFSPTGMVPVGNVSRGNTSRRRHSPWEAFPVGSMIASPVGQHPHEIPTGSMGNSMGLM